MESQKCTCLLVLWLCEGRVQKRSNGLCPLFCLGESCSPALVLMPDTSFPSCMSLVPFKPLPWCWSSEGVRLSKSIFESLERNCLGIQQFLPLTQTPMVFAARSCADLSSWHWNPGIGGLAWGWNSLFLRYPS